ncbi:S26 family signal peptidase [Psychrobacter sp. I-STPA10]|uniref:S26 family signal peptidase n=1 Tax=Psychrobacter sp. I-STPA10 TaxID=2585769 RepID=UPI001E2E1B7F|nr:S26 family signal peptidase [Psychrobacter sp. I-STPA10]
MFRLRILKVTGNSMHPTLESGAFVLVMGFVVNIKRLGVQWQPSLKVGDIVAVRHSQYGDIIKRICQIEYDDKRSITGLYLVGDNPSHSVSTEQMGLVEVEQVIGKVVWWVNG